MLAWLFSSAIALGTHLPLVLRSYFRFCGISNSYVKRSTDEIPASVAAPQPKSAVDGESTKKKTTCQNTTVPQPHKSEMQKVSPNVGLQSPTVVKEVKSESNHTEPFHQASKPIAAKEKIVSLPASKKKAQSDKTSSSTGGSLANLWGRVPAKSKLGDNHADANHATAANPTGWLHLLVDFVQNFASTDCETC